MNILVGLSGGVDSAVAAYLLKEQGHQIVGGFMLNYLDESDPNCSTKQDLESFYEVCKFLDIPYEIIDFRKEYEEKILNYIYEGYLRGITPNPDVLCNTEVKFKLFLDEALKLGYDMIATGHYAQIQLPASSYQFTGPKAELPVVGKTENHDPKINSRRLEAGGWRLLRGIDPLKDQSYFLAGLNQFQLSKAFFPLGGMTKVQVREIADRIGLPNAKRKDSQGLCFVGNIPMADFLKKKMGSKPGNIVLQDGTIVGKHEGAYLYTIGQRRNIGLHFQCYVVGIDIQHNIVVVSKDPEDKDLYREQVGVQGIHRISGQEPTFPLHCKCKVRYRQELQECTVSKAASCQLPANSKTTLEAGSWKLEATQIIIHFTHPQKGVPNGQIAVLYGGENNEEVLGCGEISDIIQTDMSA